MPLLCIPFSILVTAWKIPAGMSKCVTTFYLFDAKCREYVPQQKSSLLTAQWNFLLIFEDCSFSRIFGLYFFHITHSAANFKTNCLGRFSLLLVLEGRGSKMIPKIGSGGFSVPCLHNASNYMTAASFHIPFNSSCHSVLEFRTLRTVVNYHHMKVCWDVDIELHRVVISRQ